MCQERYSGYWEASQEEKTRSSSFLMYCSHNNSEITSEDGLLEEACITFCCVMKTMIPKSNLLSEELSRRPKKLKPS